MALNLLVGKKKLHPELRTIQYQLENFNAESCFDIVREKIKNHESLTKFIKD